MNINIQYIVKFWDYLRKLFKPEREGVLLSKKQTELPEYSVAKNLVKNNIAHATNVSFISQYSFDEGSTNVGDNLGTGSRLIRKSFGSSSTAVRQVVEGQSKRSRTAPEQDSKECRTRLEAQSNNTRTGVKQKISGRVNPDFFLTNLTPTSKFLRLGFDLASGFHRLQCMKSRRIVEQNLSRSRKRGQDREKKASSNLLDVANSKLRHFLAGTRYIPAFNLLRTLFYLRPSLHRMCTVPLPSPHQEKGGATTVKVCCSYGETYYKGKRRLKESPNKIRTNGFAFFMVFMKNVLAKIVLDVRSAYGLFTNALLKRYQKGTGNVLESYQRATGASSLAVLGLACARQVWEFSFPCVAQAYVMRMLSSGNAWIVRKTVPIYALLTHYQRFIYASSILNPYTESALSKIRGFKRSKFFCQASEWYCINNLSKRLKCFSNQMQGGVRDVVNERFVSLLPKSTFSALLLLLLMMTFGSVTAQAQNKQNYVLQGTVVSALDKKPLQAVSVRVEADNVKTSTKKDGSFSIAVAQRTGKVKFTSVGYKTLELEYTSGTVLHVQLNPVENQLDEVEVVSTGFQKIPKERATGSFEFVDNRQLSKRAGAKIIDRLENLSNSIRIDKDYRWLDRSVYTEVSQHEFDMRGKSTMSGASSRTIIVDNVLYEGDLRDINPNDIESVSILKDAVATSTWGIYGGGGVIVLTTKKGGFNQPTTLSFNYNLGIQSKPNIYALPFMPSVDFIDYESFLFSKGYFDSKLSNKNSYPTVSPVIKLLDEVRKGLISNEQAQDQITKYKGYDIRDDYSKYIYRNSIAQQYALSLSGGRKDVNYRISGGYDKDVNNKITSDNNRATARVYLKTNPIKNLSFISDITYARTVAKDASVSQNTAYGTLDAGGGSTAWPYLKLVDEYGMPINIDAVPISKAYRDTAGNGKLMDWNYNLLNEVGENQQLYTAQNINAILGLDYQINSNLNFQLNYNYQYNPVQIKDWLGIGSFSMRHLINYYTQYNDKMITKTPVPIGDMYMSMYNLYKSQMARGQLNYSSLFNGNVHRLDVLAATEIREKKTEKELNTFWGYDHDNLSFVPVDLVSLFPYLNQKTGSAKIPNQTSLTQLNNRYISFFGNVNYSYLEKYMISGSFRKDASNLFGAKTNSKWEPLWSVGLAWNMGKESFLNNEWVNVLKLRASYGYAGKANTDYSALPVIYYNGAAPNTGLPYANIATPANPSLSWERIRTVNLGLDFNLWKDRISGSVEWYNKQSSNLLSNVLIDVTTGFESTTKNGGILKGEGLELDLKTINIQNRLINWNSRLLLNRNTTYIEKYDYKYKYAYNYVTTSGTPNAIYREGYDLSTVFAYQSAGLDPENGDPRGYLNGEISKDYRNIINGDPTNITAVGPGLPLWYGSLTNEFNFNKFSVSFNIQGRFKFFLFRQTFNQKTTAESRVGHADYASRWQKPGDELITNVPSITYPIDTYRQNFNSGTTDWVIKGDNIRLQDLSCSYNIGKYKGFKNVSIFGFVKNMNVILWRANKIGMDPEYRDAIPYPLSISFGFNLSI
ncbi:SusC/RagA family TonB-linked outer membrane protein [Sphingobacterium kitahiroshimense]|uniref:SusC/RagA family TonB-linked outer membrane protein n=1 Tax=Sphingobacterium kitahiroshimense TaxID=470446 RepID=A0ABV0BVR4_9SPHI